MSYGRDSGFDGADGDVTHYCLVEVSPFYVKSMMASCRPGLLTIRQRQLSTIAAPEALVDMRRSSNRGGASRCHAIIYQQSSITS